MPTPSKRDAARAAVPTALQAIDYLTQHGQQPLADAVSALTDYASATGFEGATPQGKTVVLYGPKDVYDRARAGSRSITVDVQEGLEAFLAGKWTPKQPTWTGGTVAKGSVSVRIPDDLFAQVEARAAELVAEHEWDTRRGYALTARHVATQWLDRKYPAPKKAGTK